MRFRLKLRCPAGQIARTMRFYRLPTANPGDAGAVMDLDANATTALLPEVFEAMLPWLRDGHGNPSASHRAA